LNAIWITEVPDPPPGIRLAVKDLFDTAGGTTTYGSPIFVDHVPTRTAECVARLERAGYADVGKTNLHEFAYGTTSQNPHFGWVSNPLAPDRIAGGSSGGSAAALAAGLADAALGTDSGGSIRIPAAYCGVVGFKPTHGLVSLDGCWPLAPSYDHAGPMARTVDDCVAMMRVLAGIDADRVALADVRVGVVRWMLERCDPLVRARVEEAAALFPQRVDVDFPAPEGENDLFLYEVARVHETLFAEHREEYGEDVARKITRCLEVTEAAARDAAASREEYRERSLERVADVDLLVTPTQPFVAPRHEDALDDRSRERRVGFTYPFNSLGWPALALPCGRAEEGLPASVQLAAPAGGDSVVLGAGLALEAAIP
jgi:aspartyl-tRNA(Asn)/glutamyl-tRNA(Gln) amidotransferase subunit A